MLIENGIDINQKDKYWNTPIFYAYTSDMINLLIKNNANMYLSNTSGMKPIDLNFISDNYEVLNLLLKYNK